MASGGDVVAVYKIRMMPIQFLRYASVVLAVLIGATGSLSQSDAKSGALKIHVSPKQAKMTVLRKDADMEIKTAINKVVGNQFQADLRCAQTLQSAENYRFSIRQQKTARQRSRTLTACNFFPTERTQRP